MPANTCREDLKNYCLRSLGAPVLQINVTPDQIEDRIDDALSTYWEFHHEGSYRDYISRPLSAQDISTRSIPVDPWVYSVLRVVRIGGMESEVNLEYMSLMQNIGTQVVVWGEGLVNYTVSMSYLSLVNDFFNREKVLSFNQKRNFVQIESEMSGYRVGDIIVLEVYRFCDPNSYRETWDDNWLKQYATALIKKQWGQNMLKYDGFTLPSGITLNGRSIYQDALTDIADLENKLHNQETIPTDFFIRITYNARTYKVLLLRPNLCSAVFWRSRQARRHLICLSRDSDITARTYRV